jgi:GntR family transcriptional regulator
VSYDSVFGVRWLVDYHSGVPVYLQLVQQAKSAVAAGTLRAGDQLPSVRAMAEELKLNRNTVARAWAELESEGVLENRQGSGCFVTSSVTPLRRAVRNERLATALDQVIVQAHHLQVDDEALRTLLDDRLRHFRTTRRAAAEGEEK